MPKISFVTEGLLNDVIIALSVSAAGKTNDKLILAAIIENS